MIKKVTKEQYQEFLKDYAWQLLKHPDYRLGEAFLNYFTKIHDTLLMDSDGRDCSWALYQTKDNKKAQHMIDHFIEK